MIKIANKKLISIFIIILIISATVLSACNYSFNYNDRILNSDEYFVKIKLTQKGIPPIYLNCTYKDGAFAYRYSLQENVIIADIGYRQIFSGNKMYEIEEASALGVLNVGQYKVTENVDPKSTVNFMYTYLYYITKGTYLTLLRNPKKVTVDGIECDKFEFTYDGKEFKYFFDRDDMLIYKLNFKDNKNDIELIYKEYKFSNVEVKDFKLPTSGLYKKVDKLVYQFALEMLK